VTDTAPASRPRRRHLDTPCCKRLLGKGERLPARERPNDAMSARSPSGASAPSRDRAGRGPRVAHRAADITPNRGHRPEPRIPRRTADNATMRERGPGAGSAGRAWRPAGLVTRRGHRAPWPSGTLEEHLDGRPVGGEREPDRSTLSASAEREHRRRHVPARPIPSDGPYPRGKARDRKPCRGRSIAPAATRVPGGPLDRPYPGSEPPSRRGSAHRQAEPPHHEPKGRPPSKRSTWNEARRRQMRPMRLHPGRDSGPHDSGSAHQPRSGSRTWRTDDDPASPDRPRAP
jgi:hypothetical protein